MAYWALQRDISVGEHWHAHGYCEGVVTNVSLWWIEIMELNDDVIWRIPVSLGGTVLWERLPYPAVLQIQNKHDPILAWLVYQVSLIPWAHWASGPILLLILILVVSK
jgi:hypothetical protein